MQQMEINNTSSNSNKRKQPSEMNQSYLWHLRLGYINLSRIQRIIADELLGSLVVEIFPTCESYLEEKITKKLLSLRGMESKIY